MHADVTAAVDELYRTEWGRILATLIRLVGDFDLAEDTAQAALGVAAEQWRASGVPEYPRAWIIQTARHKSIDRIRRARRFESVVQSYATSGAIRAVDEPIYEGNEIPDDR